MASGFLPSKDKLAARTPMRCPVCDGDLHRVMVRDLGGVSADLFWQLHAGECAEHGWFQCEVISRPPREIFAVDRPFGVARRMEIDGVEVYAFATVWDDAGPDVKRSRVDPFDPRYWQTRRQAYRLQPAAGRRPRTSSSNRIRPRDARLEPTNP